MLDIDREMYLAFARALDLDFYFARDLVDGLRQAGPELARALAAATRTPERLWTTPGKTKERIVAVQVWWVVRKRQPQPPIPEKAQAPPTRECRGCE